MDHRDHVNLLRNGIASHDGASQQKTRWADFGSGSGAFTLALRELVGGDAQIFSVDQDAARLREQERAFEKQFPRSNIQFVRADFTRALALPPLDGIVMANALHFFREDTAPRQRLAHGTTKLDVLKHTRAFLKPRGVFILVEYNVAQGNLWVPHPLTFEMFCQLAPRAGFSEPRLLAKAPSNFLREFYAAAAVNEPHV